MAAVEGANQLVHVVTLLGAAIIAVPLFKRLGLGSVLGYLAAGLIIGPFGLRLFTEPQSIIHVAELGVVMFLFLIGLEMKPSHLWGLRKQIFGLGLLQVLLSGSLVMLAGKICLGFSWQMAFIIASGFVLNSTAIVMQILSERNDMGTPRGQKMISILLFEDLLIVPLLAIVAFLSPVTDNAAHEPLWQKFAVGTGSLTILIVSGIWLLNPLFKALAWTKLREMMTAAALLVVLGSALLMEHAGLSSAMGAFVAGVLLSNSSFRHQLEADIEPFRGLLLGLFFLGVGMSLDLDLVFAHFWFILFGVIALMMVNGLGVFLAALLTRSGFAEALDRAFVMALGGEFAFVIFAAAAGQRVITPQQQANGIAIIVLSMVFSPLFILLHKKYLEPRLRKPDEEREADHIDEVRPIIMVGFGRFGQIINEVLTMTNHKVTIIDRDEEIITGMRKLGIKAYYGNAERPEILHHAGIESAKMLIVTSGNKAKATHIVTMARKMNPNLRILSRAYDLFHVFELYERGADRQVRETFDSALRTARYALEDLGDIDNERIEEITRVYYEENRHRVRLMAMVHDPSYKRKFQNKEMIKVALEHDQQTMAKIQQILQRED
ncbi:monovalent cation:proton antiporter-2 (CPA2) family protein [Exercitatus varius]|uniref:Monovalent cation:proton antiporter-2 (CPA2) family protein n=1 Tax=Exercitatus varius TaxID=67857 RepID=A0AAW6QEJ4_9PAST|nr:monovalent cation:proton antiporter-2 (CPA2) family protein [Exercitatus varius]MDG2950644.1 monovalent cation:proton antiporter-2 (CPA2) family protein [Exercitatus varius]